ncbi:MAG: hypothetical protein A2V93_07885 [Ignavibacteria bacterium RBG_16_34_14]|nr:MAG: hypothetical protein A2V93_07885 [Ignavibacteria bacterium RBG_16_34_14]
MKTLTRYFFEGLIVILPTAATIYFVYLIFIKIDGLFNFNIPGIGFLITLGLILVVGFIASNIFTKGLTNLLENIFSRLPLVKLIYNSIKDLTEAFVGDKKRFNKPVLVKVSEDSDIEILGFVTEENLDLLGEKNKVAVYIPQAYNFAGNLIIVSSSRVKLINAGAEEIMTFIVTGGLSKSK